MIDSFHKLMHVVPTVGKQEGDVARGTAKCSNKIGHTLKISHADDDGALNEEAMQKTVEA